VFLKLVPVDRVFQKNTNTSGDDSIDYPEKNKNKMYILHLYNILRNYSTRKRKER